MNRVLVTGAAGKVSLALLTRLAVDTEILATDVAELDPQYTHPSIRFTRASVTDLTAMAQLMAGCTHVLHLALGDASDWRSQLSVDIDGTRTVLRAAVQADTVRRVILASTNHVGGMYERAVLAGDEPATPDDPALITVVRPDSDYGAAKAFMEAYGRFTAETTAVAVTCLRIGAVRSEDDPEKAAGEPGLDYIPGGRNAAVRRMRAVWLYHDDLERIVREELTATERWRSRYAVSDNPGRIWPLTVTTWP